MNNIDPTVPVAGAPMSAAPIRANFLAASTSIDDLYTQIAAINSGTITLTNLDISGSATIGTALGVTGDTSLSTLSASGMVTLGAGLTSSGIIRSTSGGFKFPDGTVQTTAGVVSFNTRAGAVTLTQADVTSALTFTPPPAASPTLTGTVTLPDGATWSATGFADIASYTTVGTAPFNYSPSIAHATTGLFRAFALAPTLSPSAVPTGISGLSAGVTIDTSSTAIPQLRGISTNLATGSGYTGTIAIGADILFNAPTIGGTHPITSYSSLLWVTPATNGTGITSGSVSNACISAVVPAGAPAMGGTVTNTGLAISGNGGSGAGTNTNWAINSTSTAPSQFAGNIGIGVTPVNPLDIALNQNAASNVKLLNNSAGTAAQAALVLSNGTIGGLVGMLGTGFTTAGMFRQNGFYLNANGAGGLSLFTTAAQPVYVGVNGIEVSRFTSAGLAVTGAISATAMAKVFATASAVSIPSGTATTVTAWVPTFDVNSNFVASTGVFTAPATGYYHASAGLSFGSSVVAGTVVSISVLVNGVAKIQSINIIGFTSGFNGGLHASGLVQMTAGQTISISVNQNSGSGQTLAAGASSYVSITQVP
jgi:hypothetical protein